MDTLSNNERHIIEMIHSSDDPDAVRKEIISYLKSLRKYPSQPTNVSPDSDRAAD